ncbi:MAG: amidohydrolase family protein [Planctomycetes bacterium]|nr:amidohydrolase family protein [Planctomycetota bacterium]
MDYAVRVSHYLDPVTFELSRDVILLLAGGHVAEVITGGEVSGGLDGLAKQTLDLGDAVCLPGFVNAHAHLDLSHLHRQVPRGLAFTDWARAIISGRQLPEPIIQAGIDDACRMLAATGTTAVLDISVGGDSAPALARHGIRGVLALEVLGEPGRAMQRCDEIIRARFELDIERLGSDAGMAAAPTALAGIDYGYSPHAPYSTGAELYQLAYGRAFGEGRVCTTHVAETRDELQFVLDGSGPFHDMLSSLGVDLSSFAGYGETPITLLLRDWLGPWLPAGAQRAAPLLVLVHCNYPSGEDLQWIERTQPTICWCPRSHAYFGHEPWPLREYFDSGANLVLGTDSLASNDGLDMWGEITAAALAHPDAPRTELLRMATVNGRRALGLADDVADLAIWELPTGFQKPELEQLLNLCVGNHPRLLASFSQGQLTARAI